MIVVYGKQCKRVSLAAAAAKLDQQIGKLRKGLVFCREANLDLPLY